MSTKKVIGGSVAAIVILIIAQLAAQLAASCALNLIKIPDGICNIIAGIFYVGLTYVILKIYIEKVIGYLFLILECPYFILKENGF